MLTIRRAPLLSLGNSGGGGSVPTYASLQAVIDAITAGDLTEGDYWRIAWTGDGYLGDGQVVGCVKLGAPSWGADLPGHLLGTTLITTSSAGGGARTVDGVGRPRLTVGAADADEIIVDLGFASRPLRRFRAALQYTSATPANATEVLAQIRLANAGNTAWLGPGLRHFSTWSVLLTATAGAVSPIGATPTLTSAAFAAGARVDLELTSGPDFASRSFGYRATRGSSVAESTAVFAQPAGLGDWRTSVEVRPQLRLASSGIVGQLDLIGLICEI